MDANNYFIEEPDYALLMTNTNDAVPGSLRYHLACAGFGDMIRFHPSLASLEIDINSDLLVTDNELALVCELNPRVIITSQVNGFLKFRMTR